MAHGFQIHLDEERARRLRAAADAAGVDVQVLAERMLDRALDDDDWAEDFRRIAEFERTGETIEAADWLQGLQESVRAKFRA